MAENKLTTFKEQFSDFFNQALLNSNTLKTQNIRLKLILQRLYFLDKQSELKDALRFLQDLEVISAVFYPDISSLIEEIETNLPKTVIHHGIRSITTKIHRRMGSSGRNMEQVKDLL